MLPHLRGVSLKASFTRTSHRFDFPILLSRYLDARTVAAAYLLPPVVGLTLQLCVWRPLRRRWNRHQVNPRGGTPSTCSEWKA